MAWRRRSLLLLLAALVAVASACEVAVDIRVTMERDGSGHVEVAVGLDADALERVPAAERAGGDEGDDDAGAGTAGVVRDPLDDLAALVRLADLEAAGWEVTPPTTVDGVAWVRIVKPFGTPAEATQVLGELTGPEGALSGLEMSRSTSFARDRYRFSGTVDLSEGLAVFADDGLVSALDGEPLGEDEAAMEERYGRPVSEMFDLQVQVSLPGGEVGSWSAAPGDAAVAMEADSTVRNDVVWAFVGLAVVSAVGLLVLFVVRTLRTASARR